MNWFSKIISKSSIVSTCDEFENTSQPSVSLKQPITASKPYEISDKNLTTETLKQFVSIRHLDDMVIGTLPQSCLFFKNQSLIFIHGETTERVFYLLKGTISMQPHSKNSYEIRADSQHARLPLNSGNIFGATATAATDITILAISVELNRLWAKKSQEKISCVELIDIELPDQINDNQFFKRFAQAYRENNLQLPTLPTVALKLKEAMKQDIGTDEAAEIIHIDATIVTKLIQVANSPLYSPISSITNCRDAVTLIGLAATQNLVIGISLKQLFTCKNKQLMKAMQKLWQKSLYVSSLSFVLAQECGTVNPEDALLAGLISDIGVIPLLHFAEQYPDQYPDLSELEDSIPYLCAPVGALLLHTLSFSKELSDIPHLAENWVYDSGDKLCLADIVILAKLHSHFGSKKTKGLPHINTIPAYSKLKERKLNPDFSLEILHKAKQKISTAMSILS